MTENEFNKILKEYSNHPLFKVAHHIAENNSNHIIVFKKNSSIMKFDKYSEFKKFMDNLLKQNKKENSKMKTK